VRGRGPPDFSSENEQKRAAALSLSRQQRALRSGEMAITHLPALIAVSSRLERNKMVHFYLRSDIS
jgi:hypothetical protein